MKIWLDAHLSPDLADWISETYDVECLPVRAVDLRNASDNEIFEESLRNNSILMTKDSDFVHLCSSKDKVPGVIWLTCGNTSRSNLKQILNSTLDQALEFLREGETLVEITDSEGSPKVPDM